MPEEDHSWRTIPDERERAEAESVMSRSNSIEDVQSALGPPDETMPWIDHDNHLEDLAQRYPDQYAPAQKWLRCLRYTTRWPSLFHDIYEYEGGAMEYVIWGQ